MTIVLVIIAVALFGGVWVYNRIATLRNGISKAYSDMDVQMKMRFDLVDNLVNTVKWYATDRKSVV